MRIAYRRLSGAIGISQMEVGARGLWWEKRKALVHALRSRGHIIDFTNRMTKFSFNGPPKDPGKQHDLLILEFGSGNKVFYGEDITKTLDILRDWKKPVIFLCDDPDLPFLWKDLDAVHYKGWSCWYNATRLKPFGGQPEGIPIYDFPFSSLMEPVEPVNVYSERLAYLGRPNGREKVIAALVAGNAPWQVYGKPKEWSKYTVCVLDPPDQPQRAAFYAKQLGSLVLADSKHKKLGWRTGRAFHAIMAGCPAIAEADHEALNGIAHFSSVDELKKAVDEWRNPAFRTLAWRAQVSWIKVQRGLCDHAFQRAGL